LPGRQVCGCALGQNDPVKPFSIKSRFFDRTAGELDRPLEQILETAAR
jgi:hypothetical protein